MKRTIGNAGLAAAALLAAGVVAQGAVIDFETPGQYAGNFDQIGGQLTPVQTTGLPDNYVRVTGASSLTAPRATFVYDTTPADHAVTKNTFHVVSGGPGVTLTSDVRLSIATASYGVYFINGADRTKALLALFNVNASGGLEANDNIRFTSPTSAGWNPADNSATEAGLSLTANSLADAGIPLNSFKTISVTYSIDASNHAVLSMTAGTRTLTSAPITGMAAFSDVEVAIRLSPAGAGMTEDINNVVVVPEPASMALLGLAGLGLARRRRAM